MKSLDSALAGLLGALLLIAPLALGSVHPPALKVLELGAFALVMVSAAKAVTSGAESARAWPPSLPGAAPIALLLGFFVMQGISLPPAALRVVSGEAYRFYAKALPDWPRRPPYTGLEFSAGEPAPVPANYKTYLLPSVDEVHKGARVPFAGPARTTGGAGVDQRRASRVPEAPATASTSNGAGTSSIASAGGVPWYPVSVAPSLTRSAAIEAFAWAGVFLAIVGYPFAGASDAHKFERRVLRAILISGVVVAVLGILGRAYWNGKVLWFFVPEDWGGARPSVLPRASGPFINPDDFGNFLAMVFPLAVAGTMFGVPRRSESSGLPIQWLSGSAALIILAGIILSLSRGAWLGTAAGMIVFAVILARRNPTADGKVSQWRPQRRNHASGGDSTRGWSAAKADSSGWRWPASMGRAWLPILGFLSMILLALLFVGPAGTNQTHARFANSVAPGGGGDLWTRISLWRDSLTMLWHFPIVGVGLGAWPEIFPHFQTGTWTLYFYREAHNDYVQFAAESGLLGAVLLILLLASVIRAFTRAQPASRDLPILAALMAGLTATACHEFFDFCLHIPANALLFTVLLALAVRSVLPQASEFAAVLDKSRRVYVFAAGLALAAGVLMVGTLRQDAWAYPYNIPIAKTGAEARAAVLADPLSGYSHLRLARFLGTSAMRSAQLRELSTTAWLDPLNPQARDLYAEALLGAGRTAEALSELRMAVFNSPDPGTHTYLSGPSLVWISRDEQAAIEAGFREAIAARYPGAVGGLATYYERLGRYREEADLYASAAKTSTDPERRATYLESAGEAYARVGDLEQAGAMFKQAIAASPANTASYQNLVSLVYGPDKRLDDAQKLIEQGVADGADPVTLYSALGAAAQAAGDQGLAEKAWLKALDYQPSFAMTRRVGEFYLQSRRFDDATRMLRRAAEMRPGSAETYYLLGQAEESGYQYSDADKAYGRAARISPAQFSAAYADFRRRMNAPGGNT